LKKRLTSLPGQGRTRTTGASTSGRGRPTLQKIPGAKKTRTGSGGTRSPRRMGNPTGKAHVQI